VRVESVRRRPLERRRQRGGTTDAAVRATAEMGKSGAISRVSGAVSEGSSTGTPGSEAGEVTLDAVLRRSDAVGSDSAFGRWQPAKTGLKSENMHGLAR